VHQLVVKKFSTLFDARCNHEVYTELCLHDTWYILKFKTWYVVYIIFLLILFISTQPVEFKQVVMAIM